MSDLGDEFYLVLSQKPTILGELEIVKIAPTEEGLFQMDYSKHPREFKGHIYREPIKITQEVISVPSKQTTDIDKQHE